MHQVALDRPGPDDRHLDGHVVKAARLHPRQGGHLRAALDLEDADGVRRAACSKVAASSLGMVARSTGRPRSRAEFHRVLQHGHHAKPEQVHLDDARGPRNRPCPTARRRGPACDAFSSGTIESSRPRQMIMPPRVLAEVPRQAVDAAGRARAARAARGCPRGMPGLLELRLQLQRVREIAAGEEREKRSSTSSGS